MIELKEVDERLRPRVLPLAPTSQQEIWSSSAAETLPAAEVNPERQPVAILVDGEPVGYLMLDTAKQDWDPGPDAIVMRGFFIDASRQGQGHAREALRVLPPYIRARHPDAARVSLTVNLRNPVALRAYERAGFVDTGRLYHGGRAGPQKVLTLKLL